jgi:hypothetical protein
MNSAFRRLGRVSGSTSRVVLFAVLALVLFFAARLVLGVLWAFGSLVVFVVDVVAIVDVVTGERSIVAKVVWVVLILMMPILGVLLYVVLGRDPARA